MMSGRTMHAYRDRTQEFVHVVERLRKSSLLPPVVPSSSGDGTMLGSQKSVASFQSEFNKRASYIGLQIHQTSQKLAKLAKLAKRPSVFDDPTLEIQDLTVLIKQDITALNSTLVDLQLLCDSQKESASISCDTTTHSTTVVDNLKHRLMNTTKEFQNVLTMRTENLKVHDNRRHLFSTKASKGAANPFIRQRPLGSRQTATSDAPPAPWEKSSDTSQIFQRKHMNGEASSSTYPSVQQHQQQMVPLQDSYMQSRAEALQNVESTVHDLSNIFTQLATMVSHQGELAIRIDENMDNTLGNVEGAQGALLKYLNGISSNRWLMIKIFLVLVIFLLIFLFFVA